MVRVLLLALCAAVLAQSVLADGGNLGSVLMRAKKDPDNCGSLDNPCCLRRKGGRCKGQGLECAPVAGGNLRCRACGSQGAWACAGKKCDDGLIAAEGPDGRICVPGPKVVPSDATAAVAGKDAKDKQRKKARKDGDIGKKLIGGACPSGNGDCRKSEVCIAGVCQPCGADKQPCCTKGRTPCKSYGEGSPPLVCEYRVDLAINTCGVRGADQTLVI